MGTWAPASSTGGDFIAELVTTGTELLTGRTVNTHARELGRLLGELGGRLARDTTVPDDRATIAAAVREALSRAPLVFVTGGLGPTGDDLTREAVSDVTGRRIVRDAATRALLEERAARRGRPLNAAGARQADALAGAVVLPNPAGAAPGQRLDLDSRTIVLLPGPPAEFRAVLEGSIRPWLAAREAGRRPAPEAIFMVCGAGESDLVERLDRAGFDPDPGELAYCAAPGQLEVRLTARPSAEAGHAAAAARLRALLGADAYAEGRTDLAVVVGRALAAARRTLATAESCTGGGLGRRITAVPGSSAWYAGGVIVYSNAAKQRELGVPAALLEQEGAVSEPVAAFMAAAVRARWGADYGVAVTGIAGPGGGSPDKPVGLVWLALADDGGVVVQRRQFVGDRETIRDWTAQHALDLLRRRMLKIL